jgi:hypothetical protein
LFRIGWELARQGIRTNSDGGEDVQALLVKHRDELESLRQQVITLRKGAEIDRAAASEVRSQAAIAQGNIVRLEQEIELFKSITDASIRTKGVELHSFELFEGESDNSFKYRVVFLQRAQKHATIKGNLTLEISGTDDGIPRKLALTALAPVPAPGPAGRLELNFVYFQMIEGDITLPAGFVPVRIRAEVGCRSQRIDRSFEWHLVRLEHMWKSLMSSSDGRWHNADFEWHSCRWHHYICWNPGGAVNGKYRPRMMSRQCAPQQMVMFTERGGSFGSCERTVGNVSSSDHVEPQVMLCQWRCQIQSHRDEKAHKSYWYSLTGLNYFRSWR